TRGVRRHRCGRHRHGDLCARARRGGFARRRDRACEPRRRGRRRQDRHRHRGRGGARRRRGRDLKMRSMTGFGTGSAEAGTARVNIDIRGVNQRVLDVRVSLPRDYGAWEGEVRERVRALVERGRVEVSVTRTLRTTGRRARVTVREDIAGAYVRAASTLGRHLGLAGTLSLPDLLRLPDIIAVEDPGSDIRSEEPALWRALGAALRAFDADRRREGANLGRDMRARAVTLKRIAARLRRLAPGIDAALRKHAMERIARLADGLSVDPARLAHEVASLAERADFTEELVRLDSHLVALCDAL